MAAAVCAHGGALKLFPSRRLFSDAVRPSPPPFRIVVCSEFLSSTVPPIPPPCPSTSHSKNAWKREILRLEEMKLHHQRRTESNNTQYPLENDVNLEKMKYDLVKEQEEEEEKIRKLKEQEEKMKLKAQEEEKIRKLKAQEERSRRRKEQEEDIRKQDEKIRKHKEDLKSHIYDKVLIVVNVETAKAVVHSLTTEFKHLTFACDTEVADIDVKQDTPVDHGKITCFSIYGGEGADFGENKSGIWVDVLDGEEGVLLEFKPFFEDPDIKKVWHNYSFDSHVIENYGIKLSGFHADTMHLARLWDSSRRIDGGYSLEALTRDPKVMTRESLKNGAVSAENASPAANISVGLMNTKVSMKSIFGKKKLRADGSQGKLTTLASVEMLQRGEERVYWICYSVLDQCIQLNKCNSANMIFQMLQLYMIKPLNNTTFDVGSMCPMLLPHPP